MQIAVFATLGSVHFTPTVINRAFALSLDWCPLSSNSDNKRLNNRRSCCDMRNPKYIRLSVVGILLTSSVLLSQDGKLDALLDMNLEDLMTVKVVSASREHAELRFAPSVVSVISSHDIEIQGFRSLYEILATIPGFFNSTSPSWEVISNRGFVQAQNQNYLLVIDGVPQNNEVDAGMGNAHIYPTLSNVQQIEIIRGPGSTLWGSSANVGVIHIITKSGKDISKDGRGGLIVNSSYEIDQKQKVVDIIYGNSFNNGDFSLSLTGFDSDAEHTKSYKPGPTGLLLQNHTNFLNDSRSNSLWDFDPSFNLYGKSRYKNFTLNIRHANINRQDAIVSSLDADNFGTWQHSRSFINLIYEAELNENSGLIARIFTTQFEEHISRSADTSIYSEVLDTDQLMSDKAIGGEVIYKKKTDKHSMFFGASLNRKNFTIDFGAPFISLNGSNEEVTTSLFAEDSYQLLDFHTD